MVNVSVDAPEWKIWKLSWDTRFLCPQMESIFPKRVFSSQSNLPDWCCFIFGKSKLFKLNTRIKSEACTCMKIFSLRQTLFGQAFDKEGKKNKTKWMWFWQTSVDKTKLKTNMKYLWGQTLCRAKELNCDKFLFATCLRRVLLRIFPLLTKTISTQNIFLLTNNSFHSSCLSVPVVV